MSIKEAVSLKKGPKDNPINLLLLRVNEAVKKINVWLIRDTFKVPNKKYLYEGDLKRQLEFFFPENIKKIFEKLNFRQIKKKVP